MSVVKRILNFIAGLFMFLFGVLMLLIPEDTYKLITFILMITLVVKGLRRLMYFFSMARHTVGGIVFLYQGVLLLDAGIFALTLNSVPPVYTMLYLIICMLLAGGIDVMRSNEARVMKTGRWRFQMFFGVGNIVLSVIALFFLSSGTLVSVVFAIGLLHSAVCRMIISFRRTAVVYIGG